MEVKDAGVVVVSRRLMLSCVMGDRGYHLLPSYTPLRPPVLFMHRHHNLHHDELVFTFRDNTQHVPGVSS